ncbi:hypothetical protein BH11GEM2_BH11GEM2_27340 [soil metagenome]
MIRLSGPAQPREATVRDLVTAEAVALDWRPWFRSENVGLLLTLGYLFLTALGMFHRALVFLMFRINVFDYAEPSDFLLAALRDPLIILVCIAPLPLLALYYKGAAWLQRRTKSTWLSSTERQKEFTRRYRRPLYAFTAVLWAIAASLHYASSVARDLRAGTGRRVQVELISAAQMPRVDTMPQLLLGTTQKFVFLYDAPRQVTSVIPIGNIARLRVDRRKTNAPLPVAPSAR